MFIATHKILRNLVVSARNEISEFLYLKVFYGCTSAEHCKHL